MNRPSHYRTRRRDELTPRQREVLDLVARGLTNAQIAERLGISLDGVKFHVSEVLTRLNVASREEAAAVWRAEQRPTVPGFAALPPLVRPALLVLGVVGIAFVAIWVVSLARDGGEPGSSGDPGDGTPSPTAPATSTPGSTAPATVPASPSAQPTYDGIGALPETTVTAAATGAILDIETHETRQLPFLGPYSQRSWSPDGAYIAAATESGTVIYTLSDNSLRRLSDRPSRTLAWSPAGDVLTVSEPATSVAGVVADARTAFYGVTGTDTGRLLRSLPGAPANLAWSVDGESLAAWTVGTAGDTWVWRPASGTHAFPPEVQRVTWTRDGQVMTIAAVDEKQPTRVTLLDPARDYAEFGTLEVSASWTTVTTTADGGVVYGAADGVAWVADLATGAETLTPDASTGFIQGDAFLSPDATRLALIRGLCRPDETTLVLAGGSSADLGVAGVYQAAWSPDGAILAFTTGTTLERIDADGANREVLVENVHATAPLSWSPDGRWLAYTPFFGGYGRCD